MPPPPPHRASRVNLDPSDDEEDDVLLAYVQASKSSRTGPDAERARELEQAKMAQFERGVNKKSRFQREKEEREAKKKREEEEASKAFKDFVEAFGEGSGKAGGTAAKPKGFVRAGGAVVSSMATAEDPSDGAPGEAYVPPNRPSASKTASKPTLSMFADDDEPEDKPAPKEPPGKRKRAIDSFLEELQRDQAEREERLKSKLAQNPDGTPQSISALAAFESQRLGSRDLGDPLTTNLCVLNLPANISEQVLGMFFAKYGPIGSVKIMWPRGDDFTLGGAGAGITAFRRDRSAGLTGFVSFMKRKDAEYALKETDGINWGGSVLKVGWGKAMPLPAVPVYILSESRPSRSRSRSPKRHRRSSRSTSPHRGERERRLRSKSRRARFMSSLKIDPEVEKVVRAVAARVKEHGRAFEEMVREREKNNDKFKFLRDEELPEYHLFRLLIDHRYRPPSPPPELFDDEGYASLYSTDSAEESERERVRRGNLGRLARKRFEAMLRSITLRRERIAKAMSFALEHADAADAVADVLIQSLALPSTPVPRKISRLYVVSDILHNAASVPAAWKYRQAFEARLPIVFDHFNAIYRSFPGRIKAEQFRRQITAVLEVWDAWLIFPPATLDDLNARLVGAGFVGGEDEGNVEAFSAAPAEAQNAEEKPPPVGFKPAGFKAAAFQPATAPSAGDDEDVDGEAMEDVDGEAMEDVDGEAMEDVDGEAMDEGDEDIDGVAMS